MPTNASIPMQDNTRYSGSLTPQQSVTVDASAAPGGLRTLTIAPSSEITDTRETESTATGWRYMDSAGIRISNTCFNRLVSCGFDVEGTIYYDASSGSVSSFKLEELRSFRDFKRGSSVQDVAGAIIQNTAIMGGILGQLEKLVGLLERRDPKDIKDIKDAKKGNGLEHDATGAVPERNSHP